MILRIHRLAVQTVVGVHPHEKITPQPLFIDVELDCDVDAAAKSDALGDTLDYDLLSQRIQLRIESERFELIEKVAGAALALCLEDPRVRRATVRVNKPKALPTAESVSAELTATRS